MRFVAALALLIGSIAVPIATTATADSQPAPNALGEYVPLAPSRILDTRLGTGGITGPIRSDQPFDLKVTGRAGVPDTGVLAVALDVTVDGPTGAGFLVAYPTGAPRPDVSTLNFRPAQAVPNLTVMGVGDGGAVSFVLSDGIGGAFTGQVIVDVVGWYATAAVTTPGSRLIGVTPQRILDTRTNFGGPGPVGKDGEIEVQVAGRFSDPGGAVVTSLDAVVLNLTTTAVTAPTFATVYPADQARPDVSNTNAQPGKDKAALVMVKVPANGKIHIYNALGSVQFVADVVGFYRGGADPQTYAGRVLPLGAPLRAIDTRPFNVRLGHGQSEAWALDATLGASNIQPFCPCGGVVMNVTGTDATQPTFLTVYPGEPRPDASTVNVSSGEAVANLTVAKLAPGADSNGTSYQSMLRFYNAGGFTNYIGDITAVILSD